MRPTARGMLIKGGGAALTREKIIAAASKKFVCIIDDTKLVEVLGAFPLPVEVIPMARSYVARQLVKLGGQPGLARGGGDRQRQRDPGRAPTCRWRTPWRWKTPSTESRAW